MELYWRLEDIPELRSLTKADRTELWSKMIHQRVRDRFMLALFVPYIFIIALGNYIGDLLIPFRFGSSIGGGLGAGVAIWLFFVVAIHRSRPFLKEEAQQRLKSRI